MNKNLLRSAAIYAGIGAFVLIGFQNCSQVKFTESSGTPIEATGNDRVGDPDDGGDNPGDPGNPGNPGNPGGDPTKVSLTLVPDKNEVSENQNVIVTVNFQHISNIGYTCKDRFSGDLVSSGSVTQSGQQIPVKISQDIHCVAQGTPAGSATPVKAEGDVAVNCGNRLKNSATGRCEDFTCKKVVALDRSQLANVPARTVEGICYALKLFDAIENSPSKLSPRQDGEVVSREHGGAPITNTINSYVLGNEQSEFRLAGPRSVKLSGGLDAKTPITVDNFILVGVHASTIDGKADPAKYYKAMGTEDSSIVTGQGDSHAISFVSKMIPVIGFGKAGTSTVAPLDITSSVQPQVYHKLDLRALDCGGARELSNIYLLFQ